MRKLSLVAVLAALFLNVAAFAADPSGTWKWTVNAPNGNSFESTLKLELKDKALTGTLSGFRGDTAISDASFDNDTVKFKVVRERDGQKFTSSYEGKVEGDTIKGSMELPGRAGGEARKREWTAQRAK